MEERATGVEPACPAWEFSNEITIFSFTNTTLVLIFHSQGLLLMSSNFNYFRTIYFCLGHVLGTCFLFFILLRRQNQLFDNRVEPLAVIAPTTSSLMFD